MNLAYSDILNTVMLVLTIVIGWEALQKNMKAAVSGVAGFRLAIFVGLHAYIFVAYLVFIAGAGVLCLVGFLAAQIDLAVDPAVFNVLAKRSFGLAAVSMGVGVVYEKLGRTPIKPICTVFHTHKKDRLSFLDAVAVLWCFGVCYVFW